VVGGGGGVAMMGGRCGRASWVGIVGGVEVRLVPFTMPSLF